MWPTTSFTQIKSKKIKKQPTVVYPLFAWEKINQQFDTFLA